jgi:hypothetical protein
MAATEGSAHAIGANERTRESRVIMSKNVTYTERL